jgi:hypothetical protein
MNAETDFIRTEKSLLAEGLGICVVLPILLEAYLRSLFPFTK